jgi:hypothetical protein
MITHAEPIDEDTLRIRHEFIASPDLHASVEWCSHVLSIPPRHAHVILESLARDGFLEHRGDGTFARTAPKLRR